MELKEIINEEKLKTKIREEFKYDKNLIEGNFILTDNAKERIQKLYNQLKSNIPIMLEGHTGTSKTKTAQVVCKLLGLELIRINLSSETTIEDLMGKLIADKDNSFSGFIYKKGSFSEAYSEGKVLLLDEVNLAQNPVLQCMLSALDSDKITQSVPGSGLQTFYRHPNFRIIATQNPKTGSFSFTRDRLSNKFLETFQVIEFPPFSDTELVEIAQKAAIKMKYMLENEKGTKKAKIIEQLGNFHNEWVNSELSKKSPQCYTVRDLNSSVKAISENISPNDVVSCFYGARYEQDVYNQMQDLLKKKYNELSKNTNILPQLPENFPKCFQSKALKQAFQFAKLGIESGKHLLFVGKEETGLTQIAQWISHYFSKNKEENFIFIFTPETTVSDLLGRYIPAPQTEEVGNIMIWEDGPLTEAIKNGYSCVFTNISSAQTKVAERLNGLFDPKDSEEDYKFDLYENSENPVINISKEFHFISTCNIDKLKYLSPALLNRLMVINIPDQMIDMKENDFLELIKIILENEFKEDEINKEVIKLIYENQKEKNYSMSKLAKYAKSVYRLYKACNKSIKEADLINYTHELLYGEKQINKIPNQIINLADSLFNKYKQSSTDEKFYFMGSDSLKKLMIIIYSCSICRIPVCLVGPTGLGKTSMARAFSEYTRNEVATMYSFNLETQVDDIFGTFTFKNGKPIIIEGPLTNVLGEGKIFIGDEFNLAEDSILQTLAIAFENFDENSSYLIPGINKKIKYNEKFFFIACQNDLSTTGRKKLPYIIEKRLRTFDYPLPDLKDLIFNCDSIIQENIDKEDNTEDKSVDGMRSRIKKEYKFNISAEKLANFMYEINTKKGKKYIGNWSMRNIRKILRRHLNQQQNEKSYINVSFELQIMIYILSEIPTEKRKEAYKEVMEMLNNAFKLDNSLIKDIEDVINGKPRIEIISINNVSKTFLFKGKSGIEIGNDFNDMVSLYSLMETLFYAKFAHFKEPINFCGPSSYKTFIAKKLSFGADVINLYSETSIEQLLGSICLVNNFESKLYYIENILKINGNEEKLNNYKKIIQNYFDKKMKYENCIDNLKREDAKRGYKNANDSFKDLRREIISLIEEKKKDLPECIYLSLKSLNKKLFEVNDNNKGIFKDFTSIFKPGILLEKILKQSPIILKNLSNLSTAVLERFNDLFNYSPKLTLNEDFCDTFTSEMKPKEISNFSDKFRVISISTLSGIRNLSDAAKSRFTTIYTSEYDGNEKEIAAKSFLNPKFLEKTKNSLYDIPEELFEFIKEYEKSFKTKLPFLDLIKILSIYKKIREYKNEKKVFNLILATYFGLYSNYDKKYQRDKFLKILVGLDKEKKYDENEFADLSSKNCHSQSPLQINDNILKSTFTEIEIQFFENDDETYNTETKSEKNMKDHISFTIPFNKLINYIHFSLALNIPLIIEGQIGIGKKTAIKYLSNILKLKDIYFSISNTTTVEDLFCKTVPIQKDSGLEFKESRSKFLDAIDCEKYADKSLENCIIILDNLQEASNNILESLIPVFDETKDKILLPDGRSIKKRKFHIIAIFDQTSKGTNVKNVLPNSIRNSSLIFKCENFLEKQNLFNIKSKMMGDEINNSKKFLDDFIQIHNYSVENHKKELFNLNDFAKFKKISKVNLIQIGRDDEKNEDIHENIIDHETLLQISLIYRFTNLEDLKIVSSKLGCSLSKDLWPIIEYDESTNEIGDISHYIKIYPIESEKNKYFYHVLSNYDTSRVEDLKRKMFTLTPEQRLGLIFLIISVKADIPCIIQGPTASGKSYLIKLFCELLGEDPEIIILNNDSGINLLTGQIAPKNEIEFKNIQAIKEAIEKCKDDEKVYSIFQENNFLDNDRDWKPKDFNYILGKLKEFETNPKVKNIAKLLRDELSFLKHLKNEDSPFINALKQGKWIILDGIESAEPELYERLSSLCDIENKKLNLFEKGPEYEYSKDNEDKNFKIHENFRLFITYNSYEVEQSKKLSSNFISRCLLYSLPPIDIDCKSSALVLSGLFNYNKTFEETEIINEPIVKEEKKPELNLKKDDEKPPNQPENKAKKGKKGKKKVKTNTKDVSSDDSDDDEEEGEEEEEGKEEEEDDKADKTNLEEKKSNEKIKEEPKEEKKEVKPKILRIKDVFKIGNKKQIILKKREVKELAIKLANIHGEAKEFVKDKIQSFAGQKNFSGRSLKYIFNSINIRKYDLSEAIVSILEDCYSNSYKNPEVLKNELIKKFFKNPINYNEIMSYLGRDETDISEKYKQLVTLTEEYIKNQIIFKFTTFLDYLNNMILKDVENYKKENLGKCLKELENKKMINEYYIFLRIIFNILSSIVSKIGDEKKCDNTMISDPEISIKIKDMSQAQKKYLLFIKLIEKNYYNFKIVYKEYNSYIDSIKKDNIKRPFFELFTKEDNIVINSITLGLLYPEIEDDENIKLIQIKKEMVMIIIKIINNRGIVDIDDYYELEIFDDLLYLANSGLFFDSFENDYTDEQLKKMVNNELEQKSTKIEEKIENIKDKVNKNINNANLNYILQNWNDKYSDFHNKILIENAKKKNDSDLAIIETKFRELIKDLKSLERDDFIERAIGYLEKMDKTKVSLENSIKYVNSIKDEYKNKKLETKKNDSLIGFEFNSEDFEENFESKLLGNEYTNKFNNVIYYLIKYNECLKIVEKIEKNNDKLENLNKLDKLLNKNNTSKKFKNGLKNLRGIIIGNNNSINIQYFKDILLSNLLLKYYMIDNSGYYFKIDNIYDEFNKYISRDNVINEDRKFAYYLSNHLPPNYEIVIPSININSILILFSQRSYKNPNPKDGLMTLELNVNKKAGEGNEFENEIIKFQKEDLNKMNMVEGLNNFVDICKKTIFYRDDIKSQFSMDLKDQKSIINELFNKKEEIRILEGGQFLEILIMIIKGLYDSSDSPKKNLETDDLFFIREQNWIEKMNEFNKHKYLIYYLFKHQEIESDMRKYLLQTDFLKNDKNKFPIYCHILRILSSKNELGFQGKTINKISGFIEEILISKILAKIKEDKTNNLNWLGLLINNTITEKYLPQKISYIYNYICKLCEIKLYPSLNFVDKFKLIIEKIFDFIIDYCLKNKIDEIFNLNINKKIENINNIDNILYLTRLDEIVLLELNDKDKEEYVKLRGKTIEIINKIEPNKNELNQIHNNLIEAIKKDTELEKKERKREEEQTLRNKNSSSYEILKENSGEYKKKFDILRDNNSLNNINFHNNMKELLNYKKNLSNFKSIYTKKKILNYIVLNIPENCKKINIKNEGEIKVSQDDLKERVYYFSKKYIDYTAVVHIDKGEKIEKQEKKLDYMLQLELEDIDQDNVNKQLNELKNKPVIVSENDIKVLLSISDKNADIAKNEVKKISDEIVIITKTINKFTNDNSGSPRVIMALNKLKEIKTKFQEVNLKNPKFLNEQKTDLKATTEICEKYENIKKKLLEEFKSLLGEFEIYNQNIENLKNDKALVTKAFELINEIKMTKNIKIDFSSFKGFILKSPYISFSKTEKKLQASYDIFNFNLGNIIPSLYGNSTFSINILSFVGKELKPEIIKDSITNKNYKNSLFISNLVKKNNPIIIKLVIPDIKVQKKEDAETNLNVKISVLNSSEIKPLIIKNKLSFHLIPLSVVIYSKKFNFILNEGKLLLEEGSLKEGFSLKINFKILNFEGNYELFKNNYSLISLEDNDVDQPKISFDYEEKSALFKIKIPQISADSINAENIKNTFHAVFSIHFSKNLIVPIEIKSKINKRDFGLFYYNNYTGEIQNHTVNKNLIIYKYHNIIKKDEKISKIYLYFRIQCNDVIDEKDDEKDDTEHNLIINVPKADSLLSFETSKKYKFKEGKTIKIQISISNYSTPDEYDKLNNYLNRNTFELEFICDNYSKKFSLKIEIEKVNQQPKIKYCSFPYFIHKNNKDKDNDFIRLDTNNYELEKENYIYFNYEETNYLKEKAKKIYNKNIKKRNEKIEFISENCKLIFKIKDFEIKHNIIIWGPYKKKKIYYENNFDSYIEVLNDENISWAKKEIESIYEIFQNKNSYDKIKNENYGNIEIMNEFIIYICKDSVPKEQKIELLNKLSVYFEEKEKIMKVIEELKNCTNNNFLPIIYHNIIFTIAKLIKKGVDFLVKCGKNYLKVLERKLSAKLIKQYNQENFEKKVINIYCKKVEEINISKKYQFDEFSNEPKKIEKIPKDKQKANVKNEERIKNEFEVETGSLENYQNNLKNLNTINKVIELIKNSYILTQSFPFLIQKISNEEATNLFTSLYSVYDSYVTFNRNIISEDTLKFCLLFESLSKKLKNEVDLNGFEKLKNLENDTNIESINLFEYPKLKVINIQQNIKWNQAIKERPSFKYFDLDLMKSTRKKEFVIQPKLNVEKRDTDYIYHQNTKNLKLAKTKKELETDKKEEEDDKLELEKENNEEDDDNSEEIYMKESEESPKEMTVNKLKKFIDNDITKYCIKLMKNEKRKNKDLIIPQSFEGNEEINKLILSHSDLGDDLNDPSTLIFQLSQICSLNLMQASIKSNTQTEKICAIIAIDCCRTIDYVHKCFHAILVFSIINCLNSLEIPYSIVLFADFKFIYTIKTFDSPHNDEIYKLIFDCLMIPRYSSRIADVCYYINNNVFHPERPNRRIFLISNGLDPNLRYGELWRVLFNNEKDKYCFYFIEPDLKSDKKIIEDIWNNFKKQTGIEVVCIEDYYDILTQNENIYTTFGNVLSEKVILTDDEKKREPINLNNLEATFYSPNYKETYTLDANTSNLSSNLLKSYVNPEDLYFYILNEPHKPSNINSKLMEKEINLITHFKIKSVEEEKNINKLSEFEVKGINMDLFDNIFPPNKPSMYCPSVKGTRLYLVGLVKYMITGGQENKIWLEKKACLKRDYRITVIIDGSVSCFNIINLKHSIKTIFTFLKILSLIEIPYFDLIIATNKKPIILSCGNDTTSSLNNKSILWQALASVLFEEKYYKCNLKDCLLYALNLKSLNLAKKTFTFVLTDGLFDEDDTNSLYNLISFLEENDISIYGVGLGAFPEKIKNIFSKAIWAKNPNNLLNALSVFYGDEITHNGSSYIEPVSPKVDWEKGKIIDDLQEIGQNIHNYITYNKLFGYLNDRTFYLESMEETANRDEADNTEKNPKINEKEFMCPEGYFKGLKVLCCCFWSNKYSEAEEEWIHPDYLKKSFKKGKKCLNDAFKYYGIDLVIKTKYDECIEELRKGGKYYAAWIICGNGTEKKDINSNLVGQFIEVLIKFWKNGGALLFWCDNQPLVYEANLFLKKVEFPGDYTECNVRFVGNHTGKKIMSQGDIDINQCGIFNNKRRFNNGKYERYSLGHNLLKIYEGYTVSFAKIKKSGVDLNEDKNDIKEEDLEDPIDGKLLPFIPFAYDHDEGLSVIFYPSSGEEGDIIIDGGFSKLFNEIEETGTYRYILNCISWTSQFSKRIKEKGDLWVENFNMDSFTYNIRYNEKWVFRKEMSKDFDIIYLIDGTGSMGAEINAAKEQVINILNELKNKYPDYSFNFGAIFYRDVIDSPSDQNDFFNLTDNMETLKNKISNMKANGGGDTPEDWVWGYKTAVENVAWREGTKLIIHIADAGAHGTEFSSGDTHPEQGPLLYKYINRCVDKEIKIIGFKIGSTAQQSFQKISLIYNTHKAEIGGKNQLIEIYDFNRGSNSEISNQFKNLVVKAATAAVPKK